MQLRAVEDREIEKILARQEEIGLQSATDGEFRRSWWHFDFLAELDGCKLVQLDHGIQFHGVQTKAESIAIAGKIGWPAAHPMLEHFKFLKAHTRLVPKMTIPSPSVLHFRSATTPSSRSIPTSTSSSPTPRRPTARRSAPSTTPAAAICSSTTRSGPISAPRSSAPRRAARGDDVGRLQERYARTINRRWTADARPT